MRARAPETLPLYVGGFLGPFGGAVLAVLVPQLRDAFGASTAAVAAAVPAYLVPFAALQLLSGTIGERLGRRRVVRAGYVAYAAASVGAALAPGIGVFLACRAAQGMANAFLTPLVLAGLAEAVPPERIGRSVGTFAAVQTAAVALSTRPTRSAWAPRSAASCSRASAWRACCWGARRAARWTTSIACRWPSPAPSGAAR